MLKRLGCFVIGVVLLFSLTACSLALPDGSTVQKDYFCGIWAVTLGEDEFLGDDIDLNGFTDPDAAAMWVAIHTVSGWEPYTQLHSGRNFIGTSQHINAGDDYSYLAESTVYLDSSAAYVVILSLYMRPDGSVYAIRDDFATYYSSGFSSLSREESHYGLAPSGSYTMINYGFTLNFINVETLDTVEITYLTADYQAIETQALTPDEIFARAQNRVVAVAVPEECEYVLVSEIRGGQKTTQPVLYSRHQEDMYDNMISHTLAIPDGSGIAKVYALHLSFAPS